ncbi:MAG: site-specific DNA-methyltransferase [Deltaproteobacteria bacterium]|nr:site-specific DNA-methyltransferase [Deltaproteobacteria bacterium]
MQYSNDSAAVKEKGRNRRTVWNANAYPVPDARFAALPPNLIVHCVQSCSRPRDLVLEPFLCSGTVGVVASRLGRRFAGIELNPDCVDIAGSRLASESFKLDWHI